MEILTTGEKIKRTRIYKGLTLKELCGEKLSVSKLSCIENDKIKVEAETLQYISEKLNIRYDYLKEDAKAQIQKNISELKKTSKDVKDYEKLMQYNLDYALENEYYDLSFELMHMVISHFLEVDNNQEVQMLTSKYYDIYTKSSTEDHYLTYNSDMGRYFFSSKEYSQAVNYYSNIRIYLEKKNITSGEELTEVIYNEINCLIKLKNYTLAEELAKQLEKLVDDITDEYKRGKIYHVLAILSLKIKNNRFSIYEEMVYSNYKDNIISKSKAMYDFASSIFETGQAEKAVDYIRSALDNYPSGDRDGKAKYMIKCISQLVKYNILDLAQSTCDEALDIAIMLDNIKYIEKAYYYKSIILQKQDNYLGAEMYMNLSTDALFKFGNKYERYQRYIEMGRMYHKLGQVQEAIKYLSLAMYLDKKI